MKLENRMIAEGMIKDSNSLQQYLEERAKKHRNLKYYSDKERIEHICTENRITLSDGEYWNDLIDKNHFQDDCFYHHFGICFSFSVSENVAMWMLYADPDGCMIDFDQTFIDEMVSYHFSIEIGYYEGKSFVREQTFDRFSNGIKMRFMDIVYYAESTKDTNCYYVKRSDESSSFIDRFLIDKSDFCKKQLPWSYENECRLIVSIPRKLIMNDRNGLFVRISLPMHSIERIRKKGRVYNSPNINKFPADESFHSLNSPSKLFGKMNWHRDIKKEIKK